MNKIMLVFYVLMISLSISNCQKIEKKFTLDDYYLKQINNYDKRMSFSPNSLNIDGKEYLYANNAASKAIEIFDVQTGEIFNSLEYQNFYIEGLFIQTFDSIFYTKFEDKKIYIQNLAGEINDSIDLGYDLGYEWNIYTDSGAPFIVKNGVVIFNITNIFGVPKCYNYPTIGLYNLKKKDKLIQFAVLPENMRNGEDWLGFNSSCCTNGEKIIASFLSNDSLFVYDYNGQLLSRKNGKSKYNINGFQPLKPEQDISKNTNEYYITQNRNISVFYDKYRDVYYRVYVQEQELVNEDGTVNQYGENPWSLQIFDSNLDLVDETQCEQKIFNFHSIIVCSEGLLIQLREQNPDDNLIRFKLLKWENE